MLILGGGLLYKKIEMENLNSILDFSYGEHVFNHQEFIKKFIDVFRPILQMKFGVNATKAKLKVSTKDINCGCPHCGDGNNYHKRRFHIYYQNYSFKCYNDCHRPFGSLYNLIHEYGLQYHFTYVELSHIKRTFEEFMSTGLSPTERKSISVIGGDIIDRNGKISTSTPEIDEYAFPREEIMTARKLREVRRCPTLIDYLQKRGVIRKDDDLYNEKLRNFAYNEYYDDLYIFNLAKNMKDIIGIQVRHLSPKTRRRFTTMNWSKIWTDIFKLEPEGFSDMSTKFDKMSMIWNAMHIDFSRPYYILEGTFDAYFIDNSIACWGLSNFVYNKSAFYITDNTLLDPAGKKKSLELIGGGYNTFLWGKFSEDFPEIAWNCKDINDIIKKYKSFDKSVLRNYFGNGEFDILNI